MTSKTYGNEKLSKEIKNLVCNQEHFTKGNDILTDDEEQGHKEAKNRAKLINLISLIKNKRRVFMLFAAIFLLVIFVFIAMALFRSTTKNGMEKNYELRLPQRNQNIEAKKIGPNQENLLENSNDSVNIKLIIFYGMSLNSDSLYIHVQLIKTINFTPYLEIF
jgi:hypothetical protein